MKLLKTNLFVLFLLFTIVLSAFARVEQKGNRVFIIDRTGTQWDVTQARSLGFDPALFQYGIGKTAFTPLDDSNVKDRPQVTHDHSRVIGIKNRQESHAYSVRKLRYHEIANTYIGDQPISAGY